MPARTRTRAGKPCDRAQCLRHDAGLAHGHCRKYSKHKSYRVTQLLKRVNVFTPQIAAAAEEARRAAPQVTPVAAAEARLDAAQARLQKLRQLWTDTFGKDAPLTGSVLPQAPKATTASV